MSVERVNKIREQMKIRQIDAFLLTNLDNIRYASGFTGSAATAVITPEKAVIFLDSRYTLQGQRECTGFEVASYTGDVMAAAAELINGVSPERVGFEDEVMTVGLHQKIKPLFEKPAKLVGVGKLIEDLRMIKDEGEIEKIKKAVALTDACFSHLLEFIKPGMTERDIALEIYTYFYKNGASQSFTSIIASGENAACPHFQPSDAKVQTGQMIKMDYGAKVDGYCADITRTIFLGEPNEKQREIYGIVAAAQAAAIEAIKPGKTGKEIDSVARDYIKSKGYGENFGHGLGHSLGLVVHDGLGFSPTSGTIMAPGMVLTVEPGIYVEGWGGVRIEDDVLVTETGCEILTKSRKDITVI